MALSTLFDLTGRNAIVTGGGFGLGKEVAEALAEAGSNVLLCARDESRCQEAAVEIAHAHGVKALATRCDVRREEHVNAVVKQGADELGSIDILVNNAGTSWGAPAEEYPLEGWQKVIDVNLTGVFLFSRAVGRAMIARGGGKIVNIASIAALGGAPPELMNAIAYNASKGGVISLTRDLAVKWARHGINVNAVAPGWFPTQMSKPLLEGDEGKYLAEIPLGRFGSADDLKGAVVFLAAKASDFVTGHVLVVDGGQSAA